MSSKKAKSTKESKVNKKSPRKKSYQHELVAPDCWVNELAEMHINDNSWKCSVTIIEEESTVSSVYMEHFNESTINGQKLSVKSISKLEVMHYVVKNRAENISDKSVTPLNILCSEIFKLVGPEFKNEIPTALLASLIKYLILEYKDLNKIIREGIEKIKREFEEYQLSLWHTSAKSVSSKQTKSSKSENKSNKLDKVKKSEKPFTKLRKRGEEWKDKTWIDDSPHDGPQLYIAISTFYDPDLPLELLHLNIPLHAIAKLSLWETNFTSHGSKDSVPTELRERYRLLQDFRHKSTPHLSSTVRKRLGNESVKTENISRFWEKINKYKAELPTALMFKNVMFLLFTPAHSCFQYDIKSFQEEIYKQISYFLYDVHEITKQHIQYVSEIKQTNVYTSEIFDLLNMKIYRSLLDSVPHETLNIPFILDAIVIQVSVLETEAGQKRGEQELLEVTNEMNIPVASNYMTIKLLKQLNLKYDLFSDQFENIVLKEEESKGNIDSCSIKHVLKHSDDIQIKTFHLQDDISEFVKKRMAHILQVAWNDILNNFFSVSHNDENVVKLCSEIIKIAKESDEHILNYYMYILTVNSILNSLLIHDLTYSTSKKNSLKDIQNLHYDRENMCEDCILDIHNEIFSVASILRNTMSNLSNDSSNSSTSYKLSDQIVERNLFYIEYMTTDVMLQWIQAACYNFNKFETRYCPFTNQVVIVFHNFLNSNVGVFEENWVGKLTTHVPLRDFVEYILEEENDWLSQFNSKSTLESSKLDKTITHYIDKPSPDGLLFLYPLQQFISHRSLKYETLLKQYKSDNKFKAPSTEKSKSPKTKTISKKSDSSKKSKGKDKQEKNISGKIVVSEDSFKEETLKKDYTFIGYDLGDPMRIQFSGLKKVKILDGCCRITLQTVQKLYGEKSQALTVTLSGHSLYYMYKPYYESTLISPFHMILSSGIILYFGLSLEENKERGSFEQIPKNFKSNGTSQASFMVNNSLLETKLMAHQTIIPTLGEHESVGSNDFTPNEWNNSNCFPQTTINKGVPYFEIPLTYDLKISLPNGLHVEFAKETSLFYVRQTLLSRSMLAKSVEKDRFRCFLSNGCIIKFLLNGKVEILSPNGMLNTVFEIKEEPVRLEKEEPTEPSEGPILKPLLSDLSVRKNKIVSSKENIQELIKSSKAQTVHKNDKTSTTDHTPTTPFINTKKTLFGTTESNTNLNNILNFECTTSDGKRFTVQNNKVTKVLKDLLTTHTVNVAENCIDSERSDGVLTKHLADGTLVVQFTDGSRITSTPVEVGEVFCEWSSEELNQWFSQFSDSTKTTVLADDLIKEKSFSKISHNSYTEKSLVSGKIETSLADIETFNKTHSIPVEKKSEREALISETSTRTLLTSMTDQYIKKKPFYHEDGFIVYHISYLMEHPNYSSVYYNANNCEVELKFPLNTNITLKSDGRYEAYFDRGSLTVDNDEIYFGKISESGDFERTIIINNSAKNNKTPVDISNFFNRMASLQLSVDEFCQSIGIQSLLKGIVMKTELESGVLLYCVDSKINEIIVDYEFNIYDLSATKEKYLTPGNSFSSIVINDNLSGFRLVSDEEVKSHLQLITDECGLLQQNDNTWKSLLTIVPVVSNESEKWLMKYQKNFTETTKISIKTSTYGRRESWIQPFVEKEQTCQDLVEYKAVIVRLLNRIPAKENILDKLKVVVTHYNRKTNKTNHTRIFLDESTVDFFSLDVLVRNPMLLCKIITDENTKKKMEVDQTRRDMKHDFLHTLVNKAVIKAKKIRKQNKEKELKSILRRKDVPPYPLSGFGYVHSILDEVLENATIVSKESSTNNYCEKVNFIIDELLSLVSKTKHGNAAEELDDDVITNETDSIGIQSLVSSIFRNVSALTEDTSRNLQKHINSIMDKPLRLVTSDDIEFISKIFGSGDSPLLNNEEFILQDVLDARLQLSNYFGNLRTMLEFYRGISPVHCHQSLL